MDFTSNEEFDNFAKGDNTIEVTGYVDSFEGFKTVGQNNKSLLKFTINNGTGRRIKVVMWDDMAKQFEKQISNKDIVHLERPKFQSVNPTYFRKETDLIPFELSCGRETIVTLQGKFNEIEPTAPTTIKTVIEHMGLYEESFVELDGYIKMPFKVNQGVIANGAIADGTFRLKIIILNYKDDPLLSRGRHVSVKGQVKPDKIYPDSLILQVKSMDDVKILNDDISPPDQLKIAIRSPLKRKHRSEEQNTHSKRMLTEEL